MARNFRRPRSAQPIADLNVTNLIDLGFTLLIIFMIATPLIIQEQAIKVNLPTETARPQEKADNTPTQVIVVDKAGTIFWGTTKVTLAELRARLGDANKRATPPVIKINGDGAGPWQNIITVHDEVMKFPNLKKMAFGTQPSK